LNKVKIVVNNKMTEWHIKPESIQHTNKNGDVLILKVGQFITYEGRLDDVRIEEFTYSNSGPIGFIYLPWRGERWGTPAISLRGNPRHVICYPHGYSHYGQHINWETVKLVNGGICPEMKTTSII
jgi:hypothetical protein